MTAFTELLTSDPTGGQIGALAESSEGLEIDSGQADTGGLNPGLFALLDASDGLLRLPASAADVDDLDGCVLYDPTWTPESSSVLYGAGKLAPLLRRGTLWAHAEEAMTLNDPVYVRHTAKDTNTVLGKIRNDADFAAASAAVITIADNDDGVYELTLQAGTGVPVTFSYTASSKTAAQIGTALSALIDAHASFVSADGGATVTVTAATATLAVTVVGMTSVEEATPNMTVVQGAQVPTCTLNSHLKVRKTSSGAGACKLRVSL